MPRVNPRNNPTMQRVETPAPVIVKTPAPVKTKRPTRSQPVKTSTPNYASIFNVIPSANAEQDRNVSQPVKKPTEWCGCEFWDVGCKAGCFSQEQIVDPIVSGSEWLAGGAEVHVTQPIVSGSEWLAGGAEVHVTQPLTDAWTETEKFFGDATASSLEAIEVFGENTVKAWDSTMQWGADVQTNIANAGDFVADTVGGGVTWLQDQAGTAGDMFSDIAKMPSGLGSMMGNMMRGMGNLANVGSSSMGWIKWVLIAIGALIAGFIAWRVLK